MSVSHQEEGIVMLVDHTAIRTEPSVRASQPAIALHGVWQHTRDRVLLRCVDLAIEPGELVAIAGPSGAGKSTLLAVMAGTAAPSAGTARLGGRDALDAAGTPGAVAFVPQEDIVHRDLTLRRTLEYAARLRLPHLSGSARRAAVDDVLARLDLRARADVRVGELSGGQRKRASVAVELLARPSWCFLDEPTSGLDPVSAAGVMRSLRALARDGITVVTTTHDPTQFADADRLVVVAPGGRVVYDGDPTAVHATFGVADSVSLYERIVEAPILDEQPPVIDRRRRRPPVRRGVDVRAAVSRWWTLTCRGIALATANRLTLGVLLGSPLLVIAMMTLLFQPVPGTMAPGAAAMALFWMAFAAFFFGLTFGLLQVVTERDVQRRERVVGVGAGVYLAAKITVLFPLLVAFCATLLVVMTGTDRIPSSGTSSVLQTGGTLVLGAFAALALGLLASAAVTDAAQATLALPMLCFPQVLFSGAVVPVATMTAPARVMSDGLATRWVFESLGRSLTPAETGPFHGALTGPWAVLGATAIVCLAGAATRLRS